MALALNSRTGNPKPGNPKQGGLVAFLKFGGLSGMGWLLDFTLLLAMVGGLGVPPFVANVISSSTAALTVFLVSRRFIFARSEGALGTRVTAYLLYTLCVIAVAALAMTWIIQASGELAQAYGHDPSRALLTAVAKVLVTPPQLLMNFLVSRHMSERTIGPGT